MHKYTWYTPYKGGPTMELIMMILLIGLYVTLDKDLAPKKREIT